MDSDNVDLFESLHELLDILGGVGGTVGREVDVRHDSIVVNQYAILRQPFGRMMHEMGESAYECFQHASKCRFDPRVVGVVALQWHGGVPAVNDRDMKMAGSRGRYRLGRGVPIGAVLTDQAGMSFDDGRAARRVVLVLSPTRRLRGGFGGPSGLSRRWVSEAALGPRLNARSGGVPLIKALIMLVELAFRMGAGAIFIETALIGGGRGAHGAVDARTIGSAEAVDAVEWCPFAFSGRRCETFSFPFSFPASLPGGVAKDWGVGAIVRVRWARRSRGFLHGVGPSGGGSGVRCALLGLHGVVRSGGGSGVRCALLGPRPQ